MARRHVERMRNLHKTRRLMEAKFGDELKRVFHRRWKRLYKDLQRLDTKRTWVVEKHAAPLEIRKQGAPEDYTDWQDWIDEFEAAVDRWVKTGSTDLVKLESDWYTERGYDVNYDPMDAVMAYRKRVGGVELKKIPQNIQDEVTNMIDNWYNTDGGIEDLTDQLSSFFSDWKAEQIAITESTRLSSIVTEELMHSNGLNIWAWESLNDWLVCDVCTDLHGQTFELGDPEPPEHPGCRCGQIIMLDESTVEVPEDIIAGEGE
jgi:SPP1 gp7 family putative phage head morphogenesis protein